jgi:predicted lipoprotein with Yx(FWY)xxD motif
LTIPRVNTAQRPRRARLALTGGAALGVVALAGAIAPATAASAHDARVKTPKTAVVVEVVNRPPYGQMLATVTGASLYTAPGSCTGGCLTVWPRLLMPKGKKIPLGASGLGTVKVKGSHMGGLQVTFNGKPLYRFSGDMGSSVNGNGVGGFMVATTG